MDNILDGMSMDIEKADRDRLRAVFPQCFVEDRLDIDKLLTMCGEYITDDFERYEFKWKGKSECLQLAQRRSLGTLRPKPEESVNFEDTGNVYIKGDNLEVLKILQSAYYRQVKMIYIDPPYNTGNDFVYEDDFKDPIEHYKEVTSQATRSNPETMGRFHTAWLNMMYPRLRLAATLLRDDGVCFISIDDNEVHNLRKLCDEVFGEENFIAQINWKGRGGRQDSKYYANIHEYIFCYAKSIDNFVAGEEIKSGDVYPKFDEKKQRFYKTQLLRKWGSNSRREDRPNLFYPITAPDGSEVYPMLPGEAGERPSNLQKLEGCWRHGASTMQKNIDDNKIEFVKQGDGSWIPYEKMYAPLEGEEATKKYTTWIENITNGTPEIKALFGTAPFDYAKSTELIKHFIKMADAQDNDIILDFFSGSATTAHAVMQLNAEDGGNRQFIMVQLPEQCDEKSEAAKAGYKTICDIGMERIRRAGAKILSEQDNAQISLGDDEKPPLDVGFKVCELDTSNLKTWDGTLSTLGENWEQTVLDRLNDMLHAVKPDRSDLDMIYEIMLKMGFPLTYKISEIDVLGKKAYAVDDFLLLICLAEGITPEMVEELCDYAPSKLVFGEECFADDTAMANAHYICQDKEIELKLV